MSDAKKTKGQLLKELEELRRKIVKLEGPESKSKQISKPFFLTEQSTSEAILSAIGDGISIQAANFRILYQNQIHKDLVGDHVGELCYKAYAKRDDICENCPLVISFKDGKIHRSERSIATDNGTLYLAVTASPLKNTEGKTIAGIEVVRDITKRKTAEKALVESERRYRTLAEAAHDMIFIINREDKVQYANSFAAQSLGYRPEEIIGVPRETLFPSDTTSRQKSFLEKVFKTGEPLYSESETQFKDRKLWIGTMLVPIKDEGGEVNSVLGISRDISETKKTEEAIKKSEEKYRMLIENIQDGVFILQDAKVKFSNEAFAKMIGYTTEELVGIDIKKLIAPEDMDMVMDRYKQRLAGKDVPKEYEFRMLHKDGVARVFVNMLVGLIDYQGKTASMGTVKDMTEHKKMETEIQKAQNLESLGILAGGIAHDFNNILTAITGNISLAKMYAKPGLEVYDILIEVEKASLRAKNLTTQLLTFSKGGIPVKKLTSITKLIKDSVSFALSGSNVKCEISIQDNLWPVEIDEGQVSHVIHHLIINAQQAMPQGGIIRLNAENIVLDKGHPLPLNAGKYIKISLNDEGIGIPQEYLSKIFDPYFTTKQEGSGLGLATAYSIIKKHDGRITVESKLGAGTTFSIYLPASETEIPAGKETLTAPIAGKGRGKILVMDDDEIVRIVVGRMLSQCGYEAGFAEDGEGAIELYKKEKESGAPFDAVIIDLVIPAGMGGKDAMQKLLKLDPDIKAIVSSGYSDDPVMSDYRTYGFKGALAKPYEIADLRQMLHNVITGAAL